MRPTMLNLIRTALTEGIEFLIGDSVAVLDLRRSQIAKGLAG